MARLMSPRSGVYGNLVTVRFKFTYATSPTTVITDAGRLPAYASVFAGGVHTLTAFNDSGTDTVDVGFRGGSATDDPDAYGTLMLVSAVGVIALDELAATTNIMNTSPVIVTVRYNGQNANATAGVAYLDLLATVGPTDGQ